MKEFINWKLFDNNVISVYQKKVEELLDGLTICDDIGCTTDHRDQIDKAHYRIVYALKEGAAPYAFNKRKKFTPVAGWNEHCKELHTRARNAFLEWVRDGKIRHGDLFQKMKDKRHDFVAALKYCKNNKNNIINTNIANEYNNKNVKEFWKCVNKKKNEFNCSRDEVIDGCQSTEGIAELFAGKFSAVTAANSQGAVPCPFEPNVSFSARIHCSKVSKAVNLLKTGVGFDGIHTNHLKYSSKLLIFFLTRFINSCFIHNYFPSPLMSGVITPLLKNKTGSVNCSDNYREVMISSNFFKVIEYILLPVLNKSISISPHQLGYQQQSSTILANVLLKETINEYIAEKSSVFSCFIDLSKAFERVNHAMLIDKLKCKNVPTFIVEILQNIFRRSNMSVYWQGVRSKEWHACRGLRQGGILSAHLFVFYFDNILNEIASMPYGCRLGLAKVNVLAYADDVVLLAPSMTALQNLVDKFVDLALLYELKINVQKTCFMIFNDKFN